MPSTKDGGKIKFGVQFDVQKSSLNEITKALKGVQDAATANKGSGLQAQFNQAADAARKLESIVSGSWNHKLDQLNLNKFNKSIKESFGDVKQLKAQLTASGPAGQAAFNSVAHSVLNTNVQLRQSNTLLDSMATSMKNTIKWGITASIFNRITGSIQQAFYYAKDLNLSLTDIRMVTGASADEMQRFAKNANQVSQNLARSTLDYTKAAVGFYRQGLGDEDVAQRTELTLKAQNVTGAGQEMADYLTSVWNGFKATNEQAEHFGDAMAKVADSSASDMSEIATAMSKVAATAETVGVGFDQLNAQIATVVAATRLAPESVGTAFKTMFARINDIKTGADEAEISLGNYSGRMAQLGFNVLDASGNLRDTGQVIEEIGGKWNTLTKEQQTYLASTMGGQRQITQVMALFNNWDKYVELLNTSLEANGTLNEKNNIYLESTKGHMQQLSTEAERLYAALVDTDAINPLIDTLKGALSLFNDFIEGIGGGTNAFINLGAIAANVFSKQIAGGINNAIQNVERLINNFKSVGTIKAFSQQTLSQVSTVHASKGDNITSSAALEKQAALAQKTLELRRGLNNEQYNQLQQLQQKIGIQQNELDYLSQYQKISQQILFTENASLPQFEEALSLQHRRTEQGKQYVNTLAQAVNQERLYSQGQYLSLSLAGQINQSLNNDLLSMEQRQRIQQIVHEAQQKGKITEQQVKEILELQNNALKRQEELENRIRQGAQGKRAAEDGTYQAKKRQQEADEAIAKATQDQAARNIKIQNAVRGITGGVQAVSSLMGGLSQALDSTNSASQRLNGMWQGLSGTIGGIANILMPGSGILVQGIFGLIQGGLKLIGVWDDIEWSIKSTEERIQAMDEMTKKISQNNVSSNKTISSLKDIKEEYETLSQKAGEYGKNINRLTDQQKNRYYELTNEFTKYNESVIRGYDDQGNAIVENQKALDDTIKKLQEEQKEFIKTQFASQGGIKAVISKQDSIIKDPIDEAKNQIAEAKSTTLDYSSLYRGGESGAIQDFSLQQFFNSYVQGDYNLLSESKELGERAFSLITEAGQTIVYSVDEAFNELNSISSEGITDEKTAKHFTNLYSSLLNYFQTLNDNSDSNITVFKTILQSLQKNSNTLLHNIQQTQDAIDQANQDISNTDLTLDSTFVLEALQAGGEGYEQAYEKLINSKYFNGSISSLLVNFLDGWKMDLQAQSESAFDIATKTAGGHEGLIQAGIQYEQQLLLALNSVGPAISQKLSQEKITGFDDLKGDLNQKTKEAARIVKEIVENIDTKQFGEDAENIGQILGDIVGQQLGIDNITVSLKEGKYQVNIENAESYLQSVTNNVEDKLKEKFKSLYGNQTFNYGNVHLDFTPEIDINAITDNPEEILENFDILNWDKYIKLTNTDGKTPQQAFEEIWSDFKNEVNEAQSTQLDFDTVFTNFDSLINNLKDKKELKQEELDYLNIMEKEDPILKSMIRGSDEYNQRLAQRKKIGESLYKNQLAQNKAEKEEQIAIKEAALQQAILIEDEEEQTKLTNEIIELTGALRQIEYEELRVKQAITEEEDKRKKTLQEILNLQSQQTQSNITNVKTLKDTVEKLKDPTATLESGDFSALNYFLRNDDQAAKIAAETDGGIYSKTFIDYVSNALKDESLLQGLYSESAQEIQKQIDNIQQKIDENKQKMASDDVLRNAEEAISGERKVSTRGKEAAQRTLDQNNEYKKTDLELTGRLQNAQARLLEIQHQENEQNRIALASGEALLNIYTNLADKVSSQGRFGPDLQGDQLIQWEATLDRVAEKYPQLETQANYLKDTWLAGTKEYREALRQVKDALQQLERSELESDENAITDKLQEQLEKVKDEQLTLDIDIDPQAWESFVNDVEDFCDIEHDIIVSIHSDAEDAFDSLKDQMDEVYEAASKIGEGYKIAADDVREVNNVFPGILENAQVLHDGTVQLNQDAVQQAIAGAADTAAADAESVNQQLQSQANLLRTKAINYQQAANLARQLASGELQIEDLTADQRSTLFESFANAKQDMSNQAATQEEKDLNAVGTTASQVGGDMANSMAQAATSVVGSFAQMTNKAIANLRMIAAGVQAVKHGGMPSGSGIAGAVGSTYSGGQTSNHSNVQGTTGVTNQYSGSSGRVKDVDVQGNVVDHSLEALVNEQDWNDIADMFDQLAADANSAANDIQGMMVGNAAMTQNLANGLGNVTAGRGTSPKGGSSSSGGGNAKDPDFMEYLEDQADRYHDIDIKIKQLTDDLEELQDLQEKLYGQDLIDNLNDQLGLLEAQNKAYQKKIDIAKEEAAELRGKLAADQVAFDAEGNIINYASALGAKLQWVNNTIEYYNSLTAQEQEAYKDTVEAAKQEYEEMKKTIERYDEVTTEMIPELAKNIRENLDKQVEIKISRFKMTVDIRLDLAQAERDWNKFRKEVIDMIRDDDVLGDMKAELRDFASYYNGAGTAAVQDLTRQVSATLGQLYQMDAGQLASSYGNNRAQALEDLKKYTDDLMNNLEDVEQLIKDIKDHIFDAIDNVQDAMDEQIDNFEFISKLIDHDRKTIELMYGKDAYQSLAKYYALQEQNNNKELDFLRKEKDYWQANMLTEQAAMQQMALGSNEWAEAKKRFDAYKENWMKAVEDLNDLTESAIQNIIDKYANAIDETMSNLEKKLSNGKGYDYVKEEWQLINKEADLYYDHIDRMYETNKFEQAVKDAINANQGNIKAQKSLNDLLEEQLKYLNDKEKLTKYDIDRANALLQIEIKRLALEDARNNKTKLRLRRDSQGNYTYQYTADQGDIDNARQGLADAQNDLWQLDKDTNANWLEQFYQNQVDVQQRIKEIYKDVTLTKQQQDEQAALVYAYYQQIQDDLLKEHTGLRELMMNDAFDIYSDLYDKNVEDFRNMTEAEKSLFMEDLVPTWNSGVQQMMDIMAGEGGFLPTTQDSMEELKDLTQDYQDSLDELAAAAGVDFGDIQGGTDDVIDITEDLLDMNQQVIDSYMDELEAVKQVMGYVKQLSIAYGVAKQAAIDAATESYNYWMKEQQIAAKRAEAEAKANQVKDVPFEVPELYVADVAPVQWAPEVSYGGNGGNSYGGNGGNSYGGSPVNTVSDSNKKDSFYVPGIGTFTYDYDKNKTSSNASNKGSLYVPNSVKRYATGGYTGEWDSSPKLALLDQKELVLNAEDTENILNAVDIVRSMNDWLSSMYEGIGIPTGFRGAEASQNTTIDQNVHITAQFPNVSDHTEIERALETLVNRASQFAFNTTR